jgi:hypothetical protein
MRATRVLALVALLVGLLAACGNDDADITGPADADDTTTTAAESDPADPQDDDADEGADDGTDTDDSPAPSSGDAGTFTVDGVTYQMHEAINCELDDLGIEIREPILDTQYLGSSDDDRVTVHISLAEINDNPGWDVAYNGPEGVFGSHLTEMGGEWVGEQDDTYSEAPVSVDGNTISGAVTLYDSMTMEDTVETEFEVTFPSQTTRC